MHPVVCGVLLGLFLLCIVAVVILNCRDMRENWHEKQPPRFRDYFWKVFESVLEFFD